MTWFLLLSGAGMVLLPATFLVLHLIKKITILKEQNAQQSFTIQTLKEQIAIAAHPDMSPDDILEWLRKTGK